MGAARVLEPEVDPLLGAAARARVGAPLTDDERRSKEQADDEPWVDGDDMTTEIARRCAGE